MFVQFTAANGEPVVVNVNLVQWAGDNGDGVFLKFGPNHSIGVYGTLAQVMSKLNDAQFSRLITQSSELSSSRPQSDRMSGGWPDG